MKLSSLASVSSRPRRTGSAAALSKIAFTWAGFFAPGSTVFRRSHALHLTSDRALPAIRQAEGGVLWINEGTPRAKEVRLRAADLQSGSVLVRIDGNASFRLEVFLPGGNRLSEVYEVKSAQ